MVPMLFSRDVNMCWVIVGKFIVERVSFILDTPPPVTIVPHTARTFTSCCCLSPSVLGTDMLSLFSKVNTFPHLQVEVIVLASPDLLLSTNADNGEALVCLKWAIATSHDITWAVLSEMYSCNFPTSRILFSLNSSLGLIWTDIFIGLPGWIIDAHFSPALLRTTLSRCTLILRLTSFRDEAHLTIL